MTPEATGWRSPRVHLVLLVAVLCGWAWKLRFLQDDAFISLRYAKNCADGLGLVWNAGEHVEGYTNFLWTLILVVPFELGIDVTAFMFAAGLMCYVVTLVMTWLCALKLTNKNYLAALITVFMLGSNYTFASFATGGMETQLQTALTCSALALSLLKTSSRCTVFNAAAVSLLCSAAVLTRVDSVLLVGPVAMLTLKHAVSTCQSRSDRLKAISGLFVPVMVITATWFAWKLTFYGSLMPNTYHAKVTYGMAVFLKGLTYCRVFVLSYFVWPVLLIPLATPRRFLREAGIPVRMMLITGILWVAYIIFIGGDFIEFRFMVPFMPMFCLITVWYLQRVLDKMAVSIAVVILLVAGNIHHAATFEPGRGLIEARSILAGHLVEPDRNWKGIGLRLKELFPGETGTVTIATTAAGAIPFFSELTAVDMLGLTNRWVARNGIMLDPSGTSPGHRRLSTADYLLQREVNLVIGRPMIIPQRHRDSTVFSPQILRMFMVWDSPSAPLPAPVSIIEVPMDTGHFLNMLYLIPHPEIDEAVAKHGLRVFPVGRVAHAPGLP